MYRLVSRLRQKIRSTHSRGFTLIELMVSIAIVTMVMGIVLFKYNTMNNIVLLKSQAYELAIDIRRAQVAGVSVAGNDVVYRSRPFGIYVDGANNQYKLFHDNNGNGAYDSGEALETTGIDSRFTISCIKYETGSCINTATVLFKRPNFDAVLPGNHTELQITLSSQNGATRTVAVYVTGQVAVQ